MKIGHYSARVQDQAVSEDKIKEFSTTLAKRGEDGAAVSCCIVQAGGCKAGPCRACRISAGSWSL